MKARVGDGLEAVAELAHAPDAPTLDVLIVDAGSGDSSLAMTCPPAAFLGERFLADAHAAVRPDGLLIVNCVSRSADAFSKATQALQVETVIVPVLLSLSLHLAANDVSDLIIHSGR